MTRLMTYILALFIFLSAVLAVWMNHVDDFDPVRVAVELKAAGQRDQALDLIQFAQENKLAPAEELEGLAVAYQYTTTEKVKDVFWTGAVQGRVTNLYSGIGSVATDLLVIGDLRDLTKEGWHLISGQRVDKIVTALSAIGVGVTALEATGVGVVLDAGVAAAKAAVKYSARLVRATPNSVLKMLASGQKMGGRIYGAIWEMFRRTNLSAPSVAIILSRTSDIRLLDSAAALTRGLKRGAVVFIDRAGTSGLKTFQRFRDLGLDGYFIRAVKTNPRGVLGVSRFNTLVRSAKIVKKQGWLAPLAVGLSSLASLMALMPPALPWLVLIVTGLYLWWRWTRRRWFRLGTAPAKYRRREQPRAQAQSGEQIPVSRPSSGPDVLFYHPEPSGPAPFRPANDPARRARPGIVIDPKPGPAEPVVPSPSKAAPEKSQETPTPRREDAPAAKVEKNQPPAKEKPKEPTPPPVEQPVVKAKVEPTPPPVEQPVVKAKVEPTPPPVEQPVVKAKVEPTPPPEKTEPKEEKPPLNRPPEEPSTETEQAKATARKGQAKREALAKQPSQSASQIADQSKKKEPKKMSEAIGKTWADFKKIDWLREKEDPRPTSSKKSLDSGGAKDAAGSVPPEYELSATQIALHKADDRIKKARTEKNPPEGEAITDQAGKANSQPGESQKGKGIRMKFPKTIEAWKNVPWSGKKD